MFCNCKDRGNLPASANPQYPKEACALEERKLLRLRMGPEDGCGQSGLTVINAQDLSVRLVGFHPIHRVMEWVILTHLAMRLLPKLSREDALEHRVNSSVAVPTPSCFCIRSALIRSRLPFRLNGLANH